MKDLKFEADDLVIRDGDLDLVEGVAKILQDLSLKARAFTGRWGMDPTFGSRIPEMVNAPKTPIAMVELKRELKRLMEEDDRITPGSVKVRFKDGKVRAVFEIGDQTASVEVAL
ncbi:MAG: DUF2634 domain-containing protein [Candidatus Hydrothermae bacterium]|nr:DUF2634 domain-containing protein [Candidatus Hydrothermae bacterium]